MSNLTTDHIKDAVTATRAVCQRNVAKLLIGHYDTSALAEMKRAALMDALLADDNLCEMLAGRINQISHGVSREAM